MRWGALLVQSLGSAQLETFEETFQKALADAVAAKVADDYVRNRLERAHVPVWVWGQAGGGKSWPWRGALADWFTAFRGRNLDGDNPPSSIRSRASLHLQSSSWPRPGNHLPKMFGERVLAVCRLVWLIDGRCAAVRPSRER